MTQLGRVGRIKNRSYEDYESLHKHLRKIHGDKAEELIFQHKQLSTASAVDVSNKGTTPITITQIGKTETALKVKSSDADAGLEGAVITAHYLDQDGVQKTATIASAVADMSGAGGTDFDTPVADFYCWDIEEYGDECFTSSIAVGDGLTLDVGVAGTGNAQIIAAAVKGTKLSYIGVGTVYGQEVGAANANAGFVVTLGYKTPWGRPLVAYETINANADLQGQLFLDSDGFPIQAYYRTDYIESDNLMVDEFEVTNYNVNAFYGVIDIGNYKSVHTRYMALGSAYGKSYLGDVSASFPSVADVLTSIIYYTPKDNDFVNGITFDTFVSNSYVKPEQLEPLSEVYITINDGNVAHANANIALRIIEVLV